MQYKLLEFFWPLLEPDKNPKNSVEEGILEVDEEIIDLAYDLQLKINENEKERLKDIESKSALLLSTITIGSSIVVASSTLVLGQNHSIFIKISTSLSCVISTYALRTVWYSIKALERGEYQVLSFVDINIKRNKIDYVKKIIETLNSIAVNNQKIINQKIDNMVLAQEYYKRAVITILIYTLIILVFIFFKS